MKMVLHNDSRKFCVKNVEEISCEMKEWNSSSFVPWLLNETQFLKDLLTEVLPMCS